MVDDEVAVHPGTEEAVGGTAGGDAAAALVKHRFFAGVDHPVGAGVVRIFVGHHLLAEVVVLQIGVGQELGEQAHALAQPLEGRDPVGVDVLILEQRQRPLGEQMVAQLWQQILALRVPDMAPPAKMVEADIVERQIGVAVAEGGGYQQLDDNRHVADEQAFQLRETLVPGVRQNRRRVGVVEDPGIGGISAHILADGQHVGDRAQRKRKAAGAAGLLTDHAVAQRDLLIQRPHLEAAAADLGEQELHAGEGFAAIGGDDQLDLGGLFGQQQADEAAHGGDALGVIVEQHQLAQRQHVAGVEDGVDDAGGVGGSAAGYGEVIAFHEHAPADE